MYVGNKQNTGSDFVKTGLGGPGKTYGLQIPGWTEGAADPTPGAPFSMMLTPSLALDTTRAQTTGRLAAVGVAATQFARPEDSHWRPSISMQQEFFQVTTGSASGPCRIWQFIFDDISLPENGGRVYVLTKVAAGRPFYDNIAFSVSGRFAYAVTDKSAGANQVDRFDLSTGAPVAERLGDVAPGFPAEFSGIVAAPALGADWFIANTQNTPSQIFAFQATEPPLAGLE
jgi:hypothetical protein